MKYRNEVQVLPMDMSAHKSAADGHAILVVEDHDELRETLIEWLASDFSGCTFLMAGSGEEAIDRAAACHPDIVLMDIQLPKMNGIEAIRRIKEISPQTQAVILSILNVSTYKEEAMAAGACAYINKQHMHTELIPTLTKLLSP
jgi:two-component system NarL family response regulator